MLAVSVSACNAQSPAPAAHPQHAFFHVSLGDSFGGPVSGRLLLFVAPASGDGAAVDMNMMSPESVYVAAKEVAHLAPGESVDIDGDDLVFPRPISEATAGSIVCRRNANLAEPRRGNSPTWLYLAYRADPVPAGAGCGAKCCREAGLTENRVGQYTMYGAHGKFRKGTDCRR